MREFNFDGLVGPSHNYAGLSPGNLASTTHAGQISNPKQAALQGLAKMRFVARLGVGQAVLPPQPRPHLPSLRRLGLRGSDTEVLRLAAQSDAHALRLCSSASAMWTANAATIAPSTDTVDGRLHIVPANLGFLFHRAIESETTTRVLRAIFKDEAAFSVHEPLLATPALCDEGAANHMRLQAAEGAVHLFAWGRSAFAQSASTQSAHAVPGRHPARHTLEASCAVARLCALRQELPLFWQQSPLGIDAGAFHTDVLAVGTGGFLMLHEYAFVQQRVLLKELATRLGADFRTCVASQRELPVADAVGAYPFNSQILRLATGEFCILAPLESEKNAAARTVLERVIAEDNPVREVHYLDVNASMNTGGGPACLRLRVPLTEEQRARISANVFWSPELDLALTAWVERHYRDRLELQDLADPRFLSECYVALDELMQILGLGNIYDFQRP